MNSVEYLQNHNFISLKYGDQLKIKELGRPTPEINIQIIGSSRNKTYKRQFSDRVYVNTKWLCGCDIKHALFCFPCILFGGDRSWTVTGLKDLGHLSQNIKRHEGTQRHILNTVNLAVLGNTNIQTQLDNSYWIDVQRHNEQVDRNRYVLSRIINCIKFCGTFELALDKRDESDDTIFRGLVNFSADLDNVLLKHLQYATAFTSEDILDELLQCMLEVCREKIIAELEEANYLAVMIDETSDVAPEFQVVIVLRYVHQGSPVERFYGFVNSKQHDPETLAAFIQSVIDPLLTKDSSKLIAQAYDGTAFSGRDRGVHTIIKEKYHLAHFVHCYAHQLNSVMAQAVSQDAKVRVFFSSVDQVVNFFANSPQRVDILNEVAGGGLPHAVQTRWNFNSSAVNVIYEHRHSLIKCMQEIQERLTKSEVINQASAIERSLNDEIFVFWLNIFHHIMPHVDMLDQQLQKADSVQIKNLVDDFEKCLLQMRENIGQIIETGDLLCRDLEPSRKRVRFPKDNLRTAAMEVCDTIIHTTKARFDFVDHLSVATLFTSELFVKFSCAFPDEILDTVMTLYPVFERERLKTELTIIYMKLDFRNLKGAVALLSFLTSNNLEESFKETVKLLQIILTIPMTTSEPERCFSTLKKVKNFLRNTTEESRLSTLSMLSIENAFIKKDAKFNEKVIEKFANAKEGRMELLYRR